MDGSVAAPEDRERDGGDFEAMVLGAGISGLVSASVLIQQGYTRILVLDEFDHLGGNHIDETGPRYTFDIGSLVFQDDSPLLAHFPEMLPLYVPIDPSWGKLNPQGSVTAYPISLKDDVLRSGVFGCASIVFSLAAARIRNRPIRNARDFARYWIGADLMRRSGLESYMARFFGVPPEQVDLEFAEKRMLWIREHAAPDAFLKYLFRRPASRRTNRQLARPRSGFAALYQPAADRLAAAGARFRLGSQIESIGKTGSRFTVTTSSGAYVADRLVSTIPIDRAVRLCDLDIDLKLSWVTLISMFFSFSGERGFAPSILYNFAHDGAWKRLTLYSEFYGRAEGREYFTVEVIADQVGGSVAAAEADFRRHVAHNGLFTGDLTLEGSRVVPNAYPIYVDGAADRVGKALSALRAFGVQSLGRQGAFDYQPTARVSTISAEEALRPDA